MGTQEVHMKEVLPWLVPLACRAGTGDFCSALATVVGPQNIFFPHRTLFRCLCPHGKAAVLGSPVSAEDNALLLLLGIS